MLKRIQTSDQNLQLIQDNVNSALTPLQAMPLIGGLIIANVSLVSGQNSQINHRLGKAPQIVIVGAPNANSVVWQSSPATDILLTLTCSSNCTVNLLVA